MAELEVTLVGSKDPLAGSQFLFQLELYDLVCWLSRYKSSHWLNRIEQLPSGPGRYLRVTRPAPFLVQQMGRVFKFGEESHCYYLPYSPETATELRQSGKKVQEVEIRCELRMGVY